MKISRSFLGESKAEVDFGVEFQMRLGSKAVSIRNEQKLFEKIGKLHISFTIPFSNDVEALVFVIYKKLTKICDVKTICAS